MDDLELIKQLQTSGGRRAIAAKEAVKHLPENAQIGDIFEWKYVDEPPEPILDFALLGETEMAETIKVGYLGWIKTAKGWEKLDSPLKND